MTPERIAELTLSCRSSREAELLTEVRRLQALITLRCGYIVGTCADDREMKAEAKAMLHGVQT